MTDEQKAAYVMAQSVGAMAEIEMMKAANTERLAQGMALAYDESAFSKVSENFGITHNQVLGLFDNRI